MARTKRQVKELPTIWEVSDALWKTLWPIILERDPPALTGRPRTDERQALNGIIYHLRTGCQWNHLPKVFGDDSSVHRTFQRWVNQGVFQRMWQILVEHCAELGGVDWEWQSADAAMGKARFGGTASGRTPRIGPKTAPSARSWSRPTAGR
jgi:putative transposase